MSILDKIIAQKQLEVAKLQELVPLSQLKESPSFNRKTLSLKDFLLREDKSGVISEFKRQSPSKGIINASADVEQVTQAYSAAGASGLSVLTDQTFFGGTSLDLQHARSVNETPILRKDFINSEYQIYEAKALGADVILLIAAALTETELMSFTETAHQLGMEVLLEVHNEEELTKALRAAPDLIGVNNRNLKTFETTLEVSRQLISKIPEHILAVSESGISSVEAIQELMKLGYKGFLIGENFMKTDDPGKAAASFLGEIIKLKNANNEA